MLVSALSFMRKSQYTAYDAAFTAKVDAWQPLAGGYAGVLGAKRFEAFSELERARGFCSRGRTIVSLAFENRFAPLGGLAAVMRFLPGYLKKAGENAILLTPHYANIPKVKEALKSGALELVFKKQKFRAFAASDYEGVVSCYRNTEAPVTAYYIAVDGRFTADRNPYSYDNAGDILDDALAFCAAVPFVLKKLGYDKNLLFHAHDWQTAPIAVSSKLAVLDGVLESARTVLTLHNSFDSGISGSKKKLFFGDNIRGDTVLQCAIPLLNGPLVTVSAPFARELREDDVQRTVFTPHLQDVFKMNPPIGIENGMFGRPYVKYTHAAISWARQGEYGKLLEQKARFKEKMLEIANAMDHPGIIGGLREAGAADGRYPPRPVFFMSGRLDLTQKGFDVIFHAFRNLPAGAAGLIFCPSSADAEKHSRELAFFKDIADERSGDIVVWPFRARPDDYAAVMSGSSFLLMPSLYEPFGAATEGFMHGTPVIARATGGLLAQIKPYAGDGGNADEEATGILYRERASERGGWRDILHTPVGGRIKIPLYRSMVDEAYKALLLAADVFADDRSYARMMLRGIDSLKTFSWSAAVQKYRRIYDTASGRGFIDI